MTTKLLQATKNLNAAFIVCLTHYNEISFEIYQENNVYEQAQNTLESSLYKFKAVLYEELKPITDWNKQNIIFEEIRCFMDSRMFTDEFSYDNYQCIIESAPKNEAGYYLINILKSIHKATEWYFPGRYKLSRYCLGYESGVLKIDHHAEYAAKIKRVGLANILRKEDAPIIPDTSTVKDNTISVIDEDKDASSLKTRDGVWFLFTMLRQKGIINQMPDTDLSEIVSNLTGYSAEKLRQSKLQTQSSKDKLIGLLEGIITKVKAQ